MKMNTQELAVYITNKEYVEKNRYYFKIFEQDSLFNDGSNWNDIASLSKDEERRLTYLRYKRILEYGLNDMRYFDFLHFTLFYDANLDVKRGANKGVCLFCAAWFLSPIPF